MKHGWIGSHPQKFGRTKLHTKHSYISDLNSSGLYQDVDIGIERIKGRKHYSVERSAREFQWKPCFQKTEFTKLPVRESGVKKLSLTILEPKPRPERKHVTPTRKAVVHETFNVECTVTYTGTYTINNRIW